MATDYLLRPAVLFTLAILANPASAFDAAPAWLGEPDCRVAPVEPGPISELNWNGPCADGFANGKGVLSWRGAYGVYSIDAAFVRGEASGDALLKTPGYTYTGTLKAGQPHGAGSVEYAALVGRYEGEVVAGKPHGKGTKLEPNGSRYTGEWSAGQRNGWGEASFTTGGSYKGNWKNNQFHGQGAIVYAGSGHSYEGLFEEGRVAGGPEAPRGPLLAHLPIDASWNDATPEQKNIMRSMYKALEAGDEPPFPLKGERYLIEKIRWTNNSRLPHTRYMTVHVLVGKDGKALEVTTYGPPTPALQSAVEELVLREQYKPARCRGEPCEMVYPFLFAFRSDK